MGNSTYAFGGVSAAFLPGRIPIVCPPAERAPRQDASITPPRPPQTKVTSRCPSSRPTSSASRNDSAVAPSPPITEIITAATIAGGRSHLRASAGAYQAGNRDCPRSISRLVEDAAILCGRGLIYLATLAMIIGLGRI